VELILRPITPNFGLEITGIDFSKPVNAQVKKELNDSFSQYAVLVFPNQGLEPAELIQFGEIFGRVMEQQLKDFVLPDFPLVGYNSTKDLPSKNGKLQVRGENYHTDHSNDLAPPRATSLVAVQIPSYGGDTQFVDVRRAYDDLSDTQKTALKHLRSKHVHESSRSPRSFAKLSPEEMAKIPHTEQPLVIKHPSSGRPALYLNTGRMEGIEGLSADEGFALIDKLYQHATQAKYEYRHQWRVGDMVIWDNRSVMHQANADYDPEEYRYLYRVMLQGDKLQPHSRLKSI